MLKAKTTIKVGKTIFNEGQTVTGLSKIDTQWMLNKGYLEDIKEAKKEETK